MAVVHSSESEIAGEFYVNLLGDFSLGDLDESRQGFYRQPPELRERVQAAAMYVLENSSRNASSSELDDLLKDLENEGLLIDDSRDNISDVWTDAMKYILDKYGVD